MGNSIKFYFNIMLNYEDLRQDGLDRKLPVLYNIPKWKLEYKLYTGANGTWYYVPELNKRVGCTHLGKILKKTLNKSIQDYYDRWFLNITTPSQRPRCRSHHNGIKCNKFVPFKGIGKGGYRIYCSKSCCMSSDEYIKAQSNTGIERYKDPLNRKKTGDAVRKSVTPEHRKKLSESIRRAKLNNKTEVRSYSSHRGISSSIFSKYEGITIYFDSNWERKFFIDLSERDDIESIIRRYTPRIWYFAKDDNEFHAYTPDFLIIYKSGRKELIEIKPERFSKSQRVQDKKLYSERYCLENGIDEYRIITENDYKFY